MGRAGIYMRAKKVNSMKVAVYYSNNDVRIEERPAPQISDGEMLVKMKASGICGTDVMEWYRIKKAPRVLGHEMAGEIVEVGKGVEEFNLLDRVFVSHHVPCYSCRYCLAGKHTACEALHSGNYDPGGFSEYIRIPDQNVRHGALRLPDGVSYEDATMIEPLGCVVAGQKLINPKEGETVLIIGSGISGLLHIQLSKLNGAKVIATDIDSYRLQMAEEFGADHVINAAGYSADELKRVNNNRLADIVILCAGAGGAAEAAISSVNRKGAILFFSVPQNDIALPSAEFWRNEITLRFSYGAAPEDLHEALSLILNKSVDVGKMITHRIPLQDIQQGFRYASEANESLKVVVVPDNSF